MLLGAVLITAVFLRFWHLDTVPPGWRDDELINSLVISQHLLDSELAVYYADASGHEALVETLHRAGFAFVEQRIGDGFEVAGGEPEQVGDRPRTLNGGLVTVDV